MNWVRNGLTLLLISLAFGAPLRAREEKEIQDTLIQQLVDFITVYLGDMDPGKPGFVPRNASHTHDVDPAYPMAYLYQHPHPLNPYYQQPEIRDLAIAICDRIVAEKMRPEWPLYLVDQVYDLLKDHLSEEKRRAWQGYAEDYIQTRGRQPFGFTSPNHEGSGEWKVPSRNPGVAASGSGSLGLALVESPVAVRAEGISNLGCQVTVDEAIGPGSARDSDGSSGRLPHLGESSRPSSVGVHPRRRASSCPPPLPRRL